MDTDETDSKARRRVDTSVLKAQGGVAKVSFGAVRVPCCVADLYVPLMVNQGFVLTRLGRCRLAAGVRDAVTMHPSGAILMTNGITGASSRRKVALVQDHGALRSSGWLAACLMRLNEFDHQAAERCMLRRGRWLPTCAGDFYGSCV